MFHNWFLVFSLFSTQRNIQEDVPWVRGEVQPATTFWTGCSRAGLIRGVSWQEFQVSIGEQIRIFRRRHEKSRWVKGDEEKQKTISYMDDVITLLHLWGCNGVTSASAVMIGKRNLYRRYKGPQSVLLQMFCLVCHV